MAQNIEQTKSFEDRMIDRMKESASDILSDEDIQKIVTRGIEEMFFKQRRDPNSNRYHPEYLTPLAGDMVTNAIQKQFKEQVSQWVTDNHEFMQAMITDMFEVNVAKTITSSFNAIFRENFYNMSLDLQQSIRDQVLNQS